MLNICLRIYQFVFIYQFKCGKRVDVTTFANKLTTEATLLTTVSGRTKVEYARRRIELTTSVIYVGMTSKSVGATLLRIYRGLWTTLWCYMRSVPRRDIDLYELRVSGLVEHLNFPGISSGSESAMSFPGKPLKETIFFARNESARLFFTKEKYQFSTI